MKFRNSWLLLSVFASFCASFTAAQTTPTTPRHEAATSYDGKFRKSALKGVQEAYLPSLFPSSHAANLVKLQNDDILCFWFSGIHEGLSNVAIVESRLPKGSKQWTQTVEVDQQEGRSFQNPVPFQAPDGRLWLLHTSQPAGQWQTNAEVVYLTSDDNGKVWKGPMPLFTKPGGFVRQPLVPISAERWLLPMYYTPSRSITDGAESNYSAVQVTNDGGRTWKECEVPQSNGLVQQSIVKLSNGHFIGFFRSRYADFIYSDTSDDGCTWTVPVSTRLPNNNSSIQVASLKDGSLVMAFNNIRAVGTKGKPQAGPRKPLSVALSEDGGSTWPWVRDIEAGHSSPEEPDRREDTRKGEEFSYPSILQDRDGNIDVAFSYLRKTIKVVRFDKSWIKGGNTVGIFKGDRQQ
ncbi:MAG: sialidase family protein [Terriglobales bacterium]